MQKSTTEAQPLSWDDLRLFLAVARAGTATAAATQVGLNVTTVARRIRALETRLGTLLFQRSRSQGFTLTADGIHLQPHAEAMETALQAASASVSGSSHVLAGLVRVGCTEAFGTVIVTPALADFQRQHPNIRLDILPVPHFINLSRREADLAITLERPARGPYVTRRLCDYRLALYAARDYLDQHPPIRQRRDLDGHRWVTYVNDLVFSAQLLYVDELHPGTDSSLRSTSVLAQHQAVAQGAGLGMLPCFLADSDPRLVRVLPEDMTVLRQFWLSYSEDLRRLTRITAVADHLVAAVEQHRDRLLGQASLGHAMVAPFPV